MQLLCFRAGVWFEVLEVVDVLHYLALGLELVEEVVDHGVAHDPLH